MQEDTKKLLITPGLMHPLREFEALVKVSSGRPIMICGPSGVGKSLFIEVFKKIKQYEAAMERPNQKWVEPEALNVAALNDELALSELFGHCAGAFTGAIRDKVGHIEKAEASGILILDEIGKLSPRVQQQILTYIEDGYYFRVGDSTRRWSKTMILATANVWGHFEKDFWFRFDPFFVPALHERRQNVLYILAEILPTVISILRPWEVLLLLAYNWPGNVRELERLRTLIETNQALEIVAGSSESGRSPYHSSFLYNYVYPGHWDRVGVDVYQIKEVSLKLSGDLEKINRKLRNYRVSLDYEDETRAFPEIKPSEFERNLEPDKEVMRIQKDYGFKVSPIFKGFTEATYGFTTFAREFGNPYDDINFFDLDNIPEQSLKSSQIRSSVFQDPDLGPIMVGKTFDEIQKIYFQRLFNRCEGNIAEVGRQADITRRIAAKILKDLHITKVS